MSCLKAITDASKKNIAWREIAITSNPHYGYTARE